MTGSVRGAAGSAGEAMVDLPAADLTVFLREADPGV